MRSLFSLQQESNQRKSILLSIVFAFNFVTPILHFLFLKFLKNILFPVLGSLIETPAVRLPLGNAGTLPVVKPVTGKQQEIL